MFIESIRDIVLLVKDALSFGRSLEVGYLRNSDMGVLPLVLFMISFNFRVSFAASSVGNDIPWFSHLEFLTSKHNKFGDTQVSVHPPSNKYDAPFAS